MNKKLNSEEKELLRNLLQKDGEVEQEIIEQLGIYTCNGPSAPRRGLQT